MGRPRRVVVEADGGSRGNPGEAAYGALVRDADSGALLAERADPIGVATNNVAEYRGLIAGLELVREYAPDAAVEVRMDSKLVIEQMAGRWKIKHPDMRPLALQAQRLVPSDVTWTWIPRAENAHADRLLNEVLDAATGRAPRGGSATAAETRTRENPMVGWNTELGEPTTLVLVRHGATRHSLEKRFSGSGGEDLPLDEVGRDQARAVGDWLRRRGGVDVLVTSPLTRARETASIVGDRLGLNPEVIDGLRETSFGDWDGHTFAEVQEKWPSELESWLASSATTPPGGESFDAVARRVRRTRDQLVSAYPARTIVAVTHVTPIKLLVRAAVDAPLRSIYRMELSPGSVSEVAWYADGHPSLRHFNLVP